MEGVGGNQEAERHRRNWVQKSTLAGHVLSDLIVLARGQLLIVRSQRHQWVNGVGLALL